MSEDTNTKKKKSRKNWVIIAVCTALLVVAGAGLIKNEEVNYVIIETSASAMASSLVEEQPKASPVLIRIADGLEAAVHARKCSPKELTAIVNTIANEQGLRFDTTVIVNALIKRFNDEYKVSETEEVYQQRILCLARGLRSGAILSENEEAEEEEAGSDIPLEGDVDAVESCDA